MGFRIEIKEPAIADLAEIVAYIARDNPRAALVLGNNLLDAALGLVDMPHKGSKYPHLPNIRKITVNPFKIFYRVNKADRIIEILRFWHSARREPKL